jgi:predicted phosphatase
MQEVETVPENRTFESAGELVRLRTQVAELRATCRRQAHVIDTLSEAVTTFHRKTKALAAENAELRLEHGSGRQRRASGSGHGRARAQK